MIDLTADERAAESTFDRFGLMNVRRGGKDVTVYFDDLLYTARRPEGEPPKKQCKRSWSFRIPLVAGNADPRRQPSLLVTRERSLN